MFQPGNPGIPTYLPKLSSTLIGMPVPEGIEERIRQRRMELEPLHTVPEDEEVTVIRRMPVKPPSRPFPRREAITTRIETPRSTYRLPTDNELAAAQDLLNEVDEMCRMRDTLLAMPGWMPVAQPMSALSRRMERLRRDAAALLRCYPMDLEE